VRIIVLYISMGFKLISNAMLGLVVQHTRRTGDRGGSGRSSLGSESPRVSVSRPNHMRDTINGQRATIAKLFEQGTLTGLSLSLFLSSCCINLILCRNSE
jgi:hypothetical protein